MDTVKYQSVQRILSRVLIVLICYLIYLRDTFNTTLLLLRDLDVVDSVRASIAGASLRRCEAA